MKKVFYLIILSLITILTFNSCSNSESNLVDWTEIKYEKAIELTTEEAESLKNSGKLTVATSPDYPPYGFLDIKQNSIKKYQGSDMFLASYLAQSLGLELEIVEASFDVLPTLLDKNADIVLAGLTYSIERDESYDFTVDYYDEGDGGQILLVLAENYDKYNQNKEGLLNLIADGFKIGAQNASVQAELVTSQLNYNPIPYAKIDEGLNLLKKGSIDAIALPLNAAENVCAQNSSFKIIDSFTFDDSKYLGTKGLLSTNSPLLNPINEAINNLEEGTFDKWMEYASIYAQAISISEEELNSNFFVRMYSLLKNYGMQFLKGTGITLLLSFITVVFGTIIALGLGFIRRSRFMGVRAIGHTYVEFVRGIPLLLLLWLLYMVSPASWPAYISVSIALFLNSGAYVAEIIRAGLEAVDKGQYEAARTLGLSKIETMKEIVLPQAIKKILPALGNEFVTLIKETSLASVFFIGDLMTIKNNITAITYLSIEPFIIVGVIYFTLTFSISKLIKYFENKMEA